MTRIDVDRVRRALSASSEAGQAPPEGGRLAAVAAVLRQGAEGAEVLLIRRAEHASDPWSGHMAFPGGRVDPTDPSLLYTAVRETREEVGLDLDQAAALLGPLDLLPAIARGKHVGMTIAPFVFALERDVPLCPNHEVVEVVWAPLSTLARGEGATVVHYDFEGQTIDLPGWDVEGRVVWGLTYRMLQALLERVGGAPSPP